MSIAALKGSIARAKLLGEVAGAAPSSKQFGQRTSIRKIVDFVEYALDVVLDAAKSANHDDKSMVIELGDLLGEEFVGDRVTFTTTMYHNRKDVLGATIGPSMTIFRCNGMSYDALLMTKHLVNGLAHEFYHLLQEKYGIQASVHAGAKYVNPRGKNRDSYLTNAEEVQARVLPYVAQYIRDKQQKMDSRQDFIDDIWNLIKRDDPEFFHIVLATPLEKEIERVIGEAYEHAVEELKDGEFGALETAFVEYRDNPQVEWSHWLHVAHTDGNTRKITHPNGVSFAIQADHDGVYLCNLKSEDKGKGHAREVLEQLTACADKVGIAIALDAIAGAGGMRQSALESFYRRLGFANVGGSNRMIYKPKVATEQAAVDPKTIKLVSHGRPESGRNFNDGKYKLYLFNVMLDGEEIAQLSAKFIGGDPEWAKVNIFGNSKGKLGVTGMRQVIKLLRKRFPKLKTVAGERISGARVKTGSGARNASADIASLGTIYHYTDAAALLGMLEKGKIRLTSVERVGGTEKDVGQNRKAFFMSLTRSKVGGYHERTGGGNYAVLIEFDYDSLAHNAKIRPVDYWGPAFRKAQSNMNEMEERLFSDEQWLTIKPSMIKSLHFKVTEHDDRYAFRLRRALIAAKSKKIPAYVYGNKVDWMAMRPQRAMTMEQLKPFIEGKEQLPYGGSRTNFLASYYEVYKKPLGQKLSKRAEDVRYKVLYYPDDARIALQSDLHNQQKSEYVGKLVKVINEHGGVEGFLAFLKDKYSKKETSMAETVSLTEWLFGAPKPLDRLKANIESAKGDWWGKLSPQEQQEYLKEHPGSRMRPTERTTETDAPAPAVEAPKRGASWVRKGMTMAGEDRAALPSHIKALKLPPAWKQLQYNEDPNADLLVIGKDAKNRDQYVYSEKFVTANQASKFARIREIDKKFDDMLGQTRKDQESDDPVKAEHALVAELVFLTGIRPGSDDDTGADKKAFGATTLEARHVAPLQRGTRLRFTGKKGVDLDLPIPDERLSKLLAERVAGKNGKDKLFPKVSDASLRDYVKTLDGGDFKTKDIRTALGTRLARTAMAKLKAPANAKDYKAAAREVGKVVSQVLGNTPAVALTSYIDPTLFTEWRATAGVE